MHKLRAVFFFGLTFLLLSCSEKKGVYDEKKDAFPAFEKSLKKTKSPKKTLVIFGANWCKDCVVLDDNMKKEPLNTFIEKNFRVIKVDVGSEGRNQKVKDFFDTPTKRGIPAIAIVDEEKNILYQSSDGKFSKARNISPEEVKVFLTPYAGH